MNDFVENSVYHLTLIRVKETSKGVWLELAFSEGHSSLSTDMFGAKGFAFQRSWVGDPTKVGMDIPCIVKHAEPGRLSETRFAQEIGFVNRQCYGHRLGDVLALRIMRFPLDYNVVQMIDDETDLYHYCPARMLPQPESELYEGMIVYLRIDGFLDNGKLLFGKTGDAPEELRVSDLARQQTHTAGVMPPEGVRREYKASIAFAADKSTPNIRMQLGFVIMREIVSFMNTEGGVLGLGFDDGGHVCGLDGDFAYLNDYFSDEDGRSYDCSVDALERLIVDVAHERILGPTLTEQLLSVKSFRATLPGGHETPVCEVTVGKSVEPVFLRIPSASGYTEGYAYYHRVNSECRKVMPDGLVSIFRNRMAVPAAASVPAPVTAVPVPSVLKPIPKEEAKKPVPAAKPTAENAEELVLRQQASLAEVFRPLDESENRKKALFFLDGEVVFGTLKTLRDEGLTQEDVLLTVRTAYRRGVDRLFLASADRTAYRVLDLRQIGAKAFGRNKTRIPGPAKEDLAYPLLAGPKDWLIELCDDNGSYAYRTVAVSDLGAPVSSKADTKPIAKGIFSVASRPDGAQFHYAIAPDINYDLAAYSRSKLTALPKDEANEPDSILRFFRQNFVEEESGRDSE